MFEYICWNMHACHSGHLNTNFFCVRDCLNSNINVFKYLFIILECIFMHQTTSYSQQLKDNVRELTFRCLKCLMKIGH